MSFFSFRHPSVGVGVEGSQLPLGFADPLKAANRILRQGTQNARILIPTDARSSEKVNYTMSDAIMKATLFFLLSQARKLEEAEVVEDFDL